MSEILRRLKNLEIFKGFKERDLKEIASSLSLISLQHREVVFEQGNPINDIYLLLSGSVKILETRSTNETIIFNFLARGDFLGVAMAGLPNPKYPTSAICNEDCTLIKIPLQYFFATLIASADIQREVNRQISERFLSFQNDICQSQSQVPVRIADFLLRLLARQVVQSGNRIQIPLTRQDIAQRIGAQTETVIRTMSQWKRLGWIDTCDRHVEILDVIALEKVCHERSNKKAARRTRSHLTDDRVAAGHS